MAKIKVDLHDVYNNSKAIDKVLDDAFREAIEKRIREVEIIPGKGSGQLRKKIERYLQQPHIKPLYHRIENDSKNFGRLFVYFRFLESGGPLLQTLCALRSALFIMTHKTNGKL